MPLTLLPWVAALAALLLVFLFYRLVFRVFGIVIVPEDRVGLVTKKYVLFGDKKSLPEGRLIATDGEAGYQAKTLAPGIYFWYWFWQYDIKLEHLTIIPTGQIGLILAKDGREIETGRILGRKVDCDSYQDAEAFLRGGGRKGRQAAVITAGTYRINTFLFEIQVHDLTRIQENMVGIVTTLDGEAIAGGQIAGLPVNGHNNFQDAETFLNAGGNRGLQQQVILSGMYNLNPWFVKIEEIRMTEIPIGHVGVVISYVGDDGQDLSGVEFRHGNIVAKGYKGVWAEPLGPGKYPINPYILRVELVPTTNLVLNWANARSESHQLDQNLSTISVRSKDGFQFNLDVSQIIHIPTTEAPKVIARFGNMTNLVSQVLEPTIGNYFRNSAQDADVIAFLTSRKERQESARAHIGKVLAEYNVNGVDTLIGDIVPPETLMKTLTDRKLAEEQKVTYETQRKAQETRQAFEKETAIADIQKDIVKADQGVIIAERIADAAVKKASGEASSLKIQAAAEAERVKLQAGAEAERTKLVASAEAEKIAKTGSAEAESILAIGKANAEAYELAVKAMGEGNFTQLKITEHIGREKIKLMPDLLITGGESGSGGPMGGLLGLKLLEQMGQRITPMAEVPVNGTAAKVEGK